MSVPPPGAKPTMMRTGPVGRSSGRAAWARPGWRPCGDAGDEGSALHGCLLVPDEYLERPYAAFCMRRARRVRGKELHRRLHARAGELHAGELQAHLAAGQRRHQRQVVAVAQVADAEHPALDLAQAGAQRAVEAFVDDLAHRVRVHALGHHHAGEHRRIHGRVGALDLQAPGLARPRARPRPSARAARTPPAGRRARAPAACRRLRPGRTAGWCWACRASSRVLFISIDLVPGPERLGQLRASCWPRSPWARAR